MRVLGFLKRWTKLQQEVFTTFRYPRKDRDWEIGEKVQIVFHPRGKDREVLGYAEIIDKVQRSFTPFSIYWTGHIFEVSDDEAIADGFLNYEDMIAWVKKTYGESYSEKPINKLTLRKVKVNE